MKVDIYIREKSGKRQIRIPLLPEKISIKGGDTIFVSYDILSRGPVSIPTGTELSVIAWESEFPGEGRKNDSMLRGAWKAPKTYHNILEDWKKKGTKLNVLVTGNPINKDVYLSSYTGDITGAFCDIAYQLEFSETRDITIKTTKVKTTTSNTNRPSEQTNAKTHTIKAGDTLWGISKKYYGTGTKWQTIYKANKDIIEATAKKRGLSSSSNGHWIFAGVTLTIPN